MTRSAITSLLVATKMLEAYSQACPDKWIGYTSTSSSISCYFATDHDESASQSNCQSLCSQSFNASLVTIEDKAENDFVFNLLNKNGSFGVSRVDRDAFSEHFYWIGLYNSHAILQGQRKSRVSYDDNDWLWVTDANASSQRSDFYLNWGEGQPNNYCGMEHCAGISLDNGLWEDVDCRVRLRCVCEVSPKDDDVEDHDENYDLTQSLELYLSTIAIREPKGKPYASGGPYRSCPRDDEDGAYVMILECAIAIAFVMLFGAVVAISSPSFLPTSQLTSCFPSFIQEIMSGRQRLPTDNNDDDIDATTTSKRDYNDEDGGGDSDDDYDDHFSAIMTIQVPSAAVSGSILEVLDPRNKEPRVIVVPEGVVAGEYFEVRHDTWRVASSKVSLNPTSARVKEFSQCLCLFGDPISASALISPKTRVNTEAFDCIRGMGSLQVSLGHFFTFYADFENAATPEFGGGNAVLMFFVMSGFLMMVGYANRGVKEKSSNICGLDLGFNLQFAKNFIRNRIARLCPVVWFSLLVCIPLSALSVAYNTTYRGIGARDVGVAHMCVQYIASFLFLQSWHKWLLGPNGPLWSLCAQVFCYFSFPFLMKPLLTVRNDFRLLTEVILYWALYIGLWNFQNSLVSGYDYISAHINPINKLPIFITGMIFASQALVNSNVQQSESAKYRWGIICNIVSIFISSYFFAQLAIGFSIENAGFLTRVAGEMFLPTTYGLWLYSLTKAPDCYAHRIFCWKPFKVMGELSFSWYVFHIPILQYYSWMRVMLGVAHLNDDYSRLIKTWELIIIIPIFFLVSKLSYFYLETPARNWLSAKQERIPKPSVLNPLYNAQP